jgi:hypothetical protein
MENYPSNSVNKRTPARPPEAKKIEKVTQGSIERRKKPLSKRFADIFVGGDARSVWNYIAFDIMVPAAKDMLSDAVSSGIDQMLFGGDQRWGSQRGRRGSRGQSGPLGTMSYGGRNGPINYQSATSRGPVGPQMSSRGRASHNFDEIVLESRADAEEVIDNMFNLLSKYEQVSVAEMYELVGATSHFTDNKWGWTSLQGSGVSRVRGGYLLNLPRPEPLD